MSYDDLGFGKTALLSFHFGDVVKITKHTGIRYQIGPSFVLFNKAYWELDDHTTLINYGLGYSWQL
jgi:hypothetical protein